MDVVCVYALLLLLSFGVLSNGLSANVSSRPAVVNIGAVFTFNSTIGRPAYFAIKQAVDDVNSNESVLHGTKLNVEMQNSKCTGFYGIIGALQFMVADVVAVIGPQCSGVANVMAVVSNELQVPLLSFGATDPTLSSLEFPFLVRTTQSDLYQMTAIADIVEHYGWKQIIAIYIDDDWGRHGLAALNDALAARRCKVSQKLGIPPGPGVSRGDVLDILVKIAVMESRVIVLHVHPGMGFTVFSLAQYLGMMTDGYVWIATDWLSSALDSSSLSSETMDSMQGALVLRQHTPNSDRKRTFYSRWNNLNNGSIGLNTYALYAYDSVWLVAHAIDSYLNKGGIISFSKDSNLNSEVGHLHLEAKSIFDGGKLLLRNILQSDLVGLTGRIKFDTDKSLIHPAYDIINVIGTGFRHIGYWSNYSGLSTLPPETLYSRPANFSSDTQQLHSVVWPGNTVKKPRGWVFPNNGKLLKIGVPNRVIYREFVSRVRGTNNTFKGFCIDVFTSAINLLPYAVPHEFISYGNDKENPNYTELVNEVAAGYFDGAVGDIAIVSNRTKIVDFTQPFAASGLVVVAPVKKLNTGAWAFLRPFSLPLWGVTAAFFLFIGVVVWTLEHRINDEFRGPPRTQLITILWFSFSTLFYSHRENTVSSLGRFVLILWLFVVLIINSSYTASLTSILTVQHLYSPIKGIETLKTIKEPIGYQVGSFAQHYLVEEIGIPEAMLKPLKTPEEYAEKLELGPKKGGVAAVVDERPYVDLFLSSQCKFRIIGQEFTKAGWGFAFPRDSPLAVDLSTAILTLSENGDLQRIYDKWLSKSTCSSETTEIDSDRLHLQSFWGLFLICGIACFIALFIYFFQILHRFRNSARADSVSDGQGSSHSMRFKKLLSIIDEKQDLSKRPSKRRKLETSGSMDSTHGESRRNAEIERLDSIL